MVYSEAGPSRSVPPPRRDEPTRPPWMRRPGEDERDRDDGRSRLSEPSSRPSTGHWSRPPSRSYRPGTGARSNTPSPTRRFDRDRDRERERFGSETRRGPPPGPGPGPGPGIGNGNGPRDRDWDNRRFDRDRRDDRFRDFSPSRGGPSALHRPSPQPPSYGGNRPHSPPRGPRLSSAPLVPGERVISGGRPPNGTQYKGSGIAGSGPSSSTPGSSNTISVPRAPRSMRGSSSPVELRHTISDTSGPSSVPSRNIDLPVTVKEETIDDNDLEEGEVVSPVRRPLEPIGISRPGDRWPPHQHHPPVGGRRRGSLSPRKQPFNPRPVSPFPRDRDRDRARGWDRDRDRERERERERSRDRTLNREWRTYRRSLSPIATRPNHDQKETPRQGDRSPVKTQAQATNAPASAAVGRANVKPEDQKSIDVSTARTSAPVKETSPPRPITPPIPSPVTGNRLHSSLGLVDHEAPPDRPDTPRLPDPGGSAVSADPESVIKAEPVVIGRPITPELPLPPTTVVDNVKEAQMDEEEEEEVEEVGEVEEVEVEEEEWKTIERPDEKEGLKRQEGRDETHGQEEQRGSPHRSLIRIPSPIRSEKMASPGIQKEPVEVAEVRASPVAEQDGHPTSAAEAPVSVATSPEATKFSLQPIATPDDGVPTLVSDTVVTPGLEQITETPRLDIEMEIDQATPALQTKLEKDAETNQILVDIVQDKDEAHQQTPSAALQQLISPSGPRITIAERRSVVLPDTAVPLSSSFGSRIRKDSMPTAGSNHTNNTDADADADADVETEGGPRTAEIKEDQPLSDLSRGATEAMKRANLIRAIRRVGNSQTDVDLRHISAWNNKVVLPHTTRIRKRASGRHRSWKDIASGFNKTSPFATDAVKKEIAHEQQTLQEKAEQLRLDYKLLNEDWTRHCEMLEAQMALRGPPPDDLYRLPILVEPDTAGDAPASGTPAQEEAPAGRSSGSRRRGAGFGDGVMSEAQYLEILGNLAEEAAKDPTNRAHKTAATVPDMLLGPDRDYLYVDDNDLVSDPTTFYDFAGKLEPLWTPEEKEIFRRVYPNCAKQFQKVADKLPNKSVGDCVQYYYRTKKDIDWKGIVAAKKGGERKRNRVAAVVKRPGKSSALLANLDRSKPTVDPNSNAPGKSTITPSRPGKASAGSGSRQREGGSGAATPSENGAAGGKRRAKANTLDVLATAMADGASSESTSRAGSEVPSAAKAKMRMSIKGKRPRVSSMTGLNTDTTDQPPPTAAAAGTSLNSVASGSGPADPQAELLPPPKRPGKRRKMVPVAGGGTEDTPDTPGGEADKPGKPRRGNTNSYWSVDEKRLVQSLHLAIGDDMERIASHIPGKSVRQVTNWLAGRAGGVPSGDGGPNDPIDRSGNTNDRHPSLQPLSVDIYGNDYSGQFQQPRLGTFPSAQASTSTSMTSPPKSFSRPGGMQISNLLNNDNASSSSGLKPNLDNIDAASDGTVEDDAMGRPPSRSTGSSSARPALGQSTSEQNQNQNRPPPDLDRYKTRHESAFLPPSNHPYANAPQNKPAPSAFYPSSRSEYPVQHPHPPPQQQQQPQQQHRSWEQPPYHHSTQHHPYPASSSVPSHTHQSRSAPNQPQPQSQPQMGHRRPSHGQPQQSHVPNSHPHGLSQHGQPQPQSQGQGQGQGPPQMGVFAAPSIPGFQGRTVYSAKREQELGIPPARNR